MVLLRTKKSFNRPLAFVSVCLASVVGFTEQVTAALVSLASCAREQHELVFVRQQDPEGKPKKANIRDNRNGTYTVSYVPDTTGRYTITIKYGGDEIPYSPYHIHAVPTGDASKCLVTGQVPPTRSPSPFVSHVTRSLLL